MSGSRRSKKLPPPSTIKEAVSRVQVGIVKMFDKADGQGVAWPTLAQVLFEAAFSFVDLAPDSPAMQDLLRRAEAGVYDRLVGNEADDLHSPRMASAEPGIDNTGMRPHRAPQPRLKP